ncbi:MAG: apolipoprotein N-acyltransferase [Legionellaceae bacterium]|nr:apolipoprotein N-acyltransferase [Legionellaceae bacterium]
MNSTITSSKRLNLASSAIPYAYLLRIFFAGILIPFGFAPFHFPGLTILGMALLYAELQGKSLKQSLLTGFIFGLGFMGLGVSWIYVSIHAYGHLNTILSALITTVFIGYIALFPALISGLYHHLAKTRSPIFLCCLFSALWCVGEFLRSTCLGGFPWLLLGFGQMDTPLKYLLPIIGVYGVGFFTCLAATFLVSSTQTQPFKFKIIWLFAFIAILLIPTSLKSIHWSEIKSKPLSVGVIQANLSMRDKWDETIFWQLLKRYQHDANALIGKKQLIVMPESAIPVPANYVGDFLEGLNQSAKHAGSTLLLGIPQATTSDETEYYNTLTTLGLGKGSYMKQHLVPFGEYIPGPFQRMMSWLNLPTSNMRAGRAHQSLITVQKHPIATLICYELAYPELLRNQLPRAEWIVSISDDGWFGHSLAVHQQLQMAQALSIQTGRYQVLANNDGLSSIIDNHGNLSESLPAFSSGVLEGMIYPATGASPWVVVGDQPILFLSLCIGLIAFFKQRRYPYQST